MLTPKDARGRPREKLEANTLRRENSPLRRGLVWVMGWLPPLPAASLLRGGLLFLLYNPA